MPSYLMIIIVIAILFGLTLLISWRDARARRKSALRRIAEKWGKDPKVPFTAEEYESIRRYTDDRFLPGAEYYTDDTTWNDCGFDEVFRRLDGCMSSAGDSVLWKWLRIPCFSEDALKERDLLMEHFSGDETLRKKVQMILASAGRMRRYSFYEYISLLDDAEPLGTLKYILLGAAALGSIVLMVFYPAPGVLLLMAALLANIFIYLREKDDLKLYLNSFQSILRLLSCADGLASVKDPVIAERTGRMKAAVKELAAFRRGSFLVMGGDSLGTGLGDMIIEYLKMMFHVDLIKFDQMLASYRGHDEACMTLIEEIGTIDAAIAAASFREQLTVWCRPEFFEEGETRITAEGLCHPLLDNPVPNDVDLSGGCLITGSNASGKSTFLKSLASAAILAQSIYTVPAASYKAPFFRTYTSMALTDSIESGESYFIVEIRSLKRILDAAEAGGPPVLGIVDEVLRGTNTTERIAASSRILATLCREGVLAVAATHDLELTVILENLYTNWHFTEEIRDNDIIFPYKLMEGRATSRNAIRLLSMAGYGAEVISSAEQAAASFEKSGEWEVIMP